MIIDKTQISCDIAAVDEKYNEREYKSNMALEFGDMVISFH